MSDTQAYVRGLTVSNPLLEPTMRAAVLALGLPQGSSGLDVGCGIGLQSAMLAQAVGPAGRVTGLDLRPEFAAHAKERARRSGLLGRVSFRQGDVRSVPFDDHSFDWAWSANCVGYAPMSPLPLVRELARVVRPGGRVILLAWSSEQLLPGYPLLEARLRATSAGLAPFASGRPPGEHFMRGLGWLREAGLEDPGAQTFAGTAHAPLSDGVCAALVALFDMRWPDAEGELAPEDRSLFRSLCRPESPECILNCPDYYAFFTYSMFTGRVAGSICG